MVPTADLRHLACERHQEAAHLEALFTDLQFGSPSLLSVPSSFTPAFTKSAYILLKSLVLTFVSCK